MSTRKIKNAKDLTTNELIYFKGHAKATYMSDGTTVEDAINNIEAGAEVDLSGYATKEELSSKQDTITDLEVIRQGAAKGATALQSYTEQYKGTVTGVKINGSTKNPSNGVVDIGTVITSHQDISGKQDKLISGTNIKTINGQSLIGSGDLTIEGGLSEANVAAVDDDNSTLDDVETNNYKKEIITINSGTVTLLPDKYYKNTGTFSVLDISLEDSLDTTHISEYCLEFTTASSGTSLSVPDTIKWANGIIPDLENNCIYQLSIMNNLGVCTKFI